MTPPAMLEITLAMLSIVGLVLLITAIFSISRAIKEELVSTASALAWTLLALLVPVLGPLGWFYYRARRTAAISATGIEDVN
ncbi:PLDc N-terminal domain-containing protein [Micrococcoides hystricis]|uniref:PLDc N-terminal domain-containing protein n=1 Tax=Micrococcoides hystricis TaxID=1572761 RepID=A0ABV6P8N6_9MICC